MFILNFQGQLCIPVEIWEMECSIRVNLHVNYIWLINIIEEINKIKINTYVTYFSILSHSYFEKEKYKVDSGEQTKSLVYETHPKFRAVERTNSYLGNRLSEMPIVFYRNINSFKRTKLMYILLYFVKWFFWNRSTEQDKGTIRSLSFVLIKQERLGIFLYWFLDKCRLWRRVILNLILQINFIWSLLIPW